MGNEATGDGKTGKQGNGKVEQRGKLQVLIVEYKELFSGGQIALLNLLREWLRSNVPIEPRVVCSPRAALAPHVRTLDIPCDTFDLGAIEKRRGVGWNLAQRVRPTLRLLQLMRQARPHVVLANDAFAFLACAPAAKIARTRAVWIKHNNFLPDNALARALVRYADHVIMLYAADRARLVQWVPHAASRISVVYTGIEPGRFAPDVDARRVTRQELGWTEEEVVVGTIGRLMPDKGLMFLLDAAAAIVGTFPRVHFLIVGEGPQRAELERRIRGLNLADRVRLTGFREDVPRLLQTMDVFVLASLAEALPIALLEAMAAARPVVATDVGGVREAVVDGETGFIVPPRDAEALARATLSLLCDAERRRAMGERGRARVASTFTLERNARQVFEVLQRCTSP